MPNLTAFAFIDAADPPEMKISKMEALHEIVKLLEDFICQPKKRVDWRIFGLDYGALINMCCEVCLT